MGSTNKHQVGDSVGRYRLIRELAVGFPGSLWTVDYRAEGLAALALARIISFPEEIDAQIRANLASAAWDALEVDHVAVGKAADIVFDESELATVYDYLDGQPVSALMRLTASRKTPVPPAVALRIVHDILSGLDALRVSAEGLGVGGAHGGLVPDACFVVSDGRTVLLDAFVAGRAAEHGGFLRIKDRVGYVAPEQFLGAPVDGRADVYAAGCILWELLANRRLHLGGIATVERNITRGQLLSLRAFIEDGAAAASDLIALVSKATHVDPLERFASVSALREAIEALPLQLDERPNVARFLAGVAEPSAEGENAAELGGSLRDALNAKGLGPSGARPTRRSQPPPSGAEDPSSSALESRVNFEVPPPFPPPEPHPVPSLEPLPHAPRVPDLALLEAASELTAPRSISEPKNALLTTTLASRQEARLPGAATHRAEAKREGSQSQARVVPPSSPSNPIPRVHKKTEPISPADAAKKALSMRSTLLGPTAITPPHGNRAAGATMTSKSGGSVEPLPGATQNTEAEKITPKPPAAHRSQSKPTGVSGATKLGGGGADAMPTVPSVAQPGIRERAPRKQTMMGLGVATPRVEGFPLQPPRPETPAPSGAADDEATSIAPPPFLDEATDADGATAAEGIPPAAAEIAPAEIAATVGVATRDPSLPESAAAEREAAPPSPSPQAAPEPRPIPSAPATTSLWTWIFGASTLVLSVVVLVLLFRTSDPPTSSASGAARPGGGTVVIAPAVSPTERSVPSPVPPASGSATDLSTAPVSPSPEPSTGAPQELLPGGALRPRTPARRVSPASRGPKFVPADL